MMDEQKSHQITCISMYSTIRAYFETTKYSFFQYEKSISNPTGEWNKSNLSRTVIANKINFILTSFPRVWGVCRRRGWLVRQQLLLVLLGKLYSTPWRGCPSRCNLHIATQPTPETISHPDYAPRKRRGWQRRVCEARDVGESKAEPPTQPEESIRRR